MAQLIQFLVALLCCLILVFSSETNNDDYKEIVQFIFNSYNEKPDSENGYGLVKIVNAYKKNVSEGLYLVQLEAILDCNNSASCIPSSLICEVGVRENVSTNTKEVLADRSKCAKKEFDPIFPSSGHGFSVENATDEIKSIAAFAVQQRENSDRKRNVVDIMLVKRQIVGNATTLYLTLKVTKTEGGDAAQFEVCEAEMNQTNEMAWESNLTCFPLNGLADDAPINVDDITTVAERAVDELDSISPSEFTLKLVEVLKAETTITPGSEGTVTHLELRLAPTLCLKNVDVESYSDNLYGSRDCQENLSAKRIICSVISWDRPWVEDTLYSEPVCYEDNSKERIQQDETTTETVQHDDPISDQGEPENEEVFIPAVEHHSIPVVEELDPIVEQILPNVEESLPPVVEEPVIVKHTYCTGCPIDLDINNPALNEFVEQALVAIDDGSSRRLMHKAIRIVKAQKQVINGVKYIIQLEVAETNCLKGSEKSRSTCESNDNGNKICLLEFLEKPWIDSSREIVSNNCTKYKNDLENDIEPHFVPNSNLARQEIFDYLDAMDESDLTIGEEQPSYGKDGLYPPESEPEEHPVESDAEKIDIKSPDGEDKRSEKSQIGDEIGESLNGNVGKAESSGESAESKESEENGHLSKEGDHRSSDESGESSGNVRREENIAQIAAYITGESRSRRESSLQPTVGGLKDIEDTEKELVEKLAQIAVNTLDEIDEDDKKRVVLEIISAKKQIVNGILYHLHLRVVSTSCSEDGESEPDCVNNQLSPVKMCKVELHRSFATDSQFDAKVVKSECAAESEFLPEKKLRRRRDVDVVTGGVFSAEVDDPYILQMANFGVSELDRSTNSLYRQCIVSLISASKQVVAGYNIYLTMELGDSVYRKGENEAEAINSTCDLSENAQIKKCDIVIWHRPWIPNSQQVTNYNCSHATRTENEVPENRRKRRSITGAPAPANISDPYILELANTGLVELDRSSNALYSQKIVRIIEATKQVVSGVKVRITMELGYTTCRKGSNENTDCQFSENSNNQICYIEIWDRQWLSDRRVLNFSCSPARDVITTTTNVDGEEVSVNQRKRRSLVGAPVSANISDPYILELANTGLVEVDRSSNALYSQKIVRIIEATKQVVSGVKIRITMELGYTTCRKGSNENTDCQLTENSNNQICHIEIWDRPWLPDRRILNTSCSPASNTIATANVAEVSSIAKRYIHVGRSVPTEINDPYVLEMAKTALTELDKSSNSLYKHKIFRIIEAQKKVVAGTVTKITVEIGFTKCRKGHETELETCELKNDSKNQICHFEVWDQPWLNKREVKTTSCIPLQEDRLKRKPNIRDELLEEFKNFLKKYNKKYDAANGEYKQRFHIFRGNLKKIDLLRKTEQGTATYGVTQFADLTVKEFKKYHLGLNHYLKHDNNIPMQQAVIPDVELPKEFDWRHYNVVTEVKNQGMCGSCWAFSVTGNVEGQWALKKGKLLSLSEQELVDCDSLDDGCNGGLPDNAYRAIEKLGGLETESDYPYEGEDEKCHFNKSKVQATIQGSVNITKNETKIAQWLYKHGPVSIGINANAMQFYTGGVSHPWKFLCNGDDLDHGVLIVGFGVHAYPLFHKVLPFWIIKNSWGEHWGEQGYYRVYRGDGTCGVNQMVTSAIVD